MNDPATAEIPLFPLNTVLFPGGPLPLRIFEPRYVDMVRRCMREGMGFGVVLLQRMGSETTPTSGIATVGTLARIEDFSQLPEGLLGLACRGERKFTLVRRWLQADGLNLGEVRWHEPEPAVSLPLRQRRLVTMLRSLLEQLGDDHLPGVPQFDDCSWVGCRLAEILPVPAGLKQHLLEIEDPLLRIQRLGEMLREEPSTDGPRRDS